ncbi:MAG: type II secretion system minor pseudopilin GspJ [Pseudomonadota bacterium]
MRTLGSRQGGFTLVEVLVSLLIFALIASACVALLSVAADSRFAVKAATDRLAVLQRTRALLKADLGQAVFRPARNEAGVRDTAALRGGEGGLLLSLTRAGWSNVSDQPRASLQRVDYVLVGDRLERRVHAHLDGARPEAPQVLSTGVKTARVVFLSDGIESPVWPTGDRRTMPDAVRVDLTLEGYGPVSQWFALDAGR